MTVYPTVCPHGFDIGFLSERCPSCIEGGDAPSLPSDSSSTRSTPDEGADVAPSEAREAAETWLGLLESGALYCRHKSFSDEDYERTAERLAHLAYAWNHDPDGVAEIFGQDGMDVVLANAAVAILEARDSHRAAPSEGKVDDLIARLNAADKVLAQFGDDSEADVAALLREAATALSEARTREDKTELVCELCRAIHQVWCAPHTIWNEIVGDTYNFLCLNCFTNLAAAKGVPFTCWFVIRDYEPGDLLEFCNPERDDYRQALAAALLSDPPAEPKEASDGEA